MDDIEFPDFDEQFECWSCHQLFPSSEGISIADNGLDDVCRECWDKIPVASRLCLGLFFRQASDGGIGLRELFEKGIADLDLVKAFGHRPGSRN